MPLCKKNYDDFPCSPARIADCQVKYELGNCMTPLPGCRRLIVLGLFLGQTTSGILLAGNPPAQSGAQANWPEEVVVTVGDIRTRIDGPKMWTMSGIDFQNTVMATEDSAYGTVLTIRGVGHLGTAHFLDVPGKPGEVEKELVTSLNLFVDEKPVADFTSAMSLSGTSFRMERTSKIRGVDLQSSVSIRDGVLVETARLQATAEMDLQTAFPLMYAWTPEATDYLFGNDSGILKRGSFLKEGPPAAGLVKDSRWMAVFNSTSGKGSVAYLLKSPPDAQSAFFLVDAPGSYRKTALHSFGETIMPKGFDGTYQMAVGFFSAAQKDWQQQALSRLDDLKRAVE